MMVPRSVSVRRSTIAGTWYPGTRSGLIQALDGHFSRVEQPPVGRELLGLISPHAGYTYSGLTAAHAYRQLQDREIETVVIVGPSHRAWLGDFAVNDEDAFETPLGQIDLDRDFIVDLSGVLSLNRMRGDQEHSVEIQLPFLQRQLGQFLLVPILMSTDDPDAVQGLAAALAATIRSRSGSRGRVLLVASSDLHHIDDYEMVVRRDKRVVDAMAAYDLEELSALFSDRQSSVCGRMPILAVLRAAKELGADGVEILHQTTSGDVTGRRWPGQYTVGYVAAAIFGTKRELWQVTLN